jgi:hypothetical protein
MSKDIEKGIRDYKNLLENILEIVQIKEIDSDSNELNKIKNWIAKQHNELGQPIKSQQWMAQLIQLITDFEKPRVYVAGAAQVGKTLSYLLSIKYACEKHKNVRILLLYPTRGQKETYPNRQLLPILETASKFGQDLKYDGADIILRYANTSKETKSSSGKSVAKAPLTSFTADVVFVEEASQITTDISVDDRLNQSIFPAQPVRAIGTYGSGNGIERLIQTNKAKQIEFLQVCSHCGCKNDGSSLLKFEVDSSGRPYNLHFRSCVNCSISRNNGQWELDNPENCDVDDNLFVSIPPFIHCETEQEYERKLKQLSIKSATEKSIANIYQQGFGMPFTYSEQRIKLSNIIRSQAPNQRVLRRCIGYDQGRKCSYKAVIDVLEDDTLFVSELRFTSTISIFSELSQQPTIPTIFAADAYPDVTLLAGVVESAKVNGLLAVQRHHAHSLWDKKIVEIYDNGVPYKVLAFQYHKWALELLELVNTRRMIFSNSCHELAEQHLSAVLVTEDKVVRPDDHCDDFFFALVFACLAGSMFGVDWEDWSNTQNETTNQTATFGW